MFIRCCFQNVPIRVPFSKSTVFKICRQKMCRFRVNRRPIRHIFCRFQNVPASCERSLRLRLQRACRHTWGLHVGLHGVHLKILTKNQTETTFTRCRQILKTVKNVTDRPHVHIKTVYLLPPDFENGRF